MFGCSMVSIGLVEAFRFSWDRRVVLGIFRVFTYFCRVQLGDPGLPKANRYRTEQPCIKGLRQGLASWYIQWKRYNTMIRVDLVGPARALAPFVSPGQAQSRWMGVFPSITSEVLGFIRLSGWPQVFVWQDFLK
uniref:Uncharacterized protein n=1 Tax=Candidatus Kentrum sp. FW TaxID=2126338 RepID=A0A450S435_9GAMM|nr:MAG: hypothetical protein BECKFW1821B_GA0114236_10013 [Candidatus Kentron sp. FW]